MAVAFFSIAFNTILASRLPVLEGTVLLLHIAGFFAIIITLWVMGPKGQSEVVLLEFADNGGWNNTGLSSMIGLLSPMAVLIGYDCSVHMCKCVIPVQQSTLTSPTAEEIQDASIVLPRAIMGSIAINATLAFVMSVTVIFTLGDIESVLSTTTGYPFIQIIFNATQSYAGTNVLVAIVVILLTVCAISELAAASRQIWSFARDSGLPGSSWLSKVCLYPSVLFCCLRRKVSPGWNIPLPALLVSLCVSVLLSLINIGSSVALNAITSLGAIAVLISYFLTISCVVYRRLWGAPLPPHRWTLGKWGIVINIGSLLFLTPLIFFLTWPLAQPVVASNMNWSSVMLVGVLIIAMIFYAVEGRHKYAGPVVHVNRAE